MMPDVCGNNNNNTGVPRDVVRALDLLRRGAAAEVTHRRGNMSFLFDEP